MPIAQQKINKIKGVADIVFCLDITGSMQPCIEQLKANIGIFAESIQKTNPNVQVDWRAKVIGYRDFEKDSEYIIDRFDFVNSPEEFKKQLSELIADGGDDEPESTLDILVHSILSSKWRDNVHKIIAVFTDASPKPNFSQITIQNFAVVDNLDVINQLIQKHRIKLFLFGPKHPTYEEISKFPRVTPMLLENAQEGLQNLDFKSMLDLIGKTVSNQVSSGELK